jgi:eukaryotic-like serine/threonine-protein kinase
VISNEEAGGSSGTRQQTRDAEAQRALTSPSVRRLEGQEGVYDITSAEPVIFGRLSVFYPARDVRSNEVVLVKSFRDAPDERSAINSFYEELRAIRQLRHPNILPILDYSAGAGPEAPPFLVLPWCRGGNLRSAQAHVDVLPLSTALEILQQIAAAVDYAHQQGVIHGDLKPENVLLSEDRRQAYLADFGMAKFFEVTDRVRSSMAGGARRGGGTSAYLSPEQLSDDKQTMKSDVYSFALIAYELLTGRLPFDVNAPLYKQLDARVSGDLLDPADANPSLSRHVQAALRHGLATNPRERPDRAADLCRMLEGSMPVPKARRDRPSRSQRIHGWWTTLPAAQKVALMLGVVTVLGGIITALIQIIPALLGKGGK